MPPKTPVFRQGRPGGNLVQGDSTGTKMPSGPPRGGRQRRSAFSEGTDPAAANTNIAEKQREQEHQGQPQVQQQKQVEHYQGQHQEEKQQSRPQNGAAELDGHGCDIADIGKSADGAPVQASEANGVGSQETPSDDLPLPVHSSSPAGIPPAQYGSEDDTYDESAITDDAQARDEADVQPDDGEPVDDNEADPLPTGKKRRSWDSEDGGRRYRKKRRTH